MILFPSKHTTILVVILGFASSSLYATPSFLAETNLLQNGRFANQGAGWSRADVLSPGQKITFSPAHFIHVVDNHLNQDGTDNAIKLWQNIPASSNGKEQIKMGACYNVQADVYGSANVQAYAELPRAYPSNSKGAEVIMGSDVINYAHIDWTFMLQSNQDQGRGLMFNLGSRKNQFGAEVFFDNVSLQEVSSDACGVSS